MTFILKRDLDMVKMSHHSNNEVSMSEDSKVMPEQTDTQTDTHADSKIHRQNENFTFLHTGAVIRLIPTTCNKRKNSTFYSMWITEDQRLD